MGRIVVGVDGSISAERALHWAASEAERRGDSLEVVTVWDNPYRDMWLPSDPPGIDPLAHVRGRLHRTVEAVLGKQPAVKVETTVAEGHAARVLIEAAKGAELLVVGSRGRGGLAGALLGSVSLSCAGHAPCPVVIVRDETTPA